MTRNLKVLGLALVALCVTSAFMASSASAAGERFRSASEKTVLTGTTEAESIEEFKASGVTVKCKGKFESTGAAKELTTLTVSPTYTECNNSTTVRTNHCAYNFASETTGATGDAPVAIECEGTPNQIEVDIKGVCILNFGPQTVGGGVHYTNVGEGVTVESTAKEIVFTKTADGTHTLCGTITGKGTYNSKASISCTVDSGTALTGTAKTTPAGVTKEGAATKCEWK
jgi:hypothetical protein